MKKKDTYKYDFKVGNKIVHSGITGDLERREERDANALRRCIWNGRDCVSNSLSQAISGYCKKLQQRVLVDAT